MAGTGIRHLAGVAGILACVAMPAAAQQLPPQVAWALSQLINAAGMQCQAGNPQACAQVSQLQQVGNELAQAQFACQNGNPQACEMFQMGAQQVLAVWQGGMAPSPAPSSPQQQAWEHQNRMQQQQMQFQQHQDRMAQQQRMNDERHRIFMEQLRR